MSFDKFLNGLTAKKEGQQFFRELNSIPGIKNVKHCIQCGTCSGSCPVAEDMKYSPRQIMALLRAGELDKILDSHSAWYCVSCYYCTERCPKNIPVTNIIYALKREALRRKKVPFYFLPATFYKALARNIKFNGRVSEVQMMADAFSQTNPLQALEKIPLAWKLFTHGRLGLIPHRAKGVKQIRQIMRLSKEVENSS